MIASTSSAPPRPSQTRFSVLAADDHAIVRSGIRLLLAGADDFQLIAEAHDPESVLAAIRQSVPDLLILDLWMGGDDGFSLMRKIREYWPTIRILTYSMNDERSHGLRALRVGAAGYLMKTRGLDELLAAMRHIAAGGRYMSPVLAEELLNNSLLAHGRPVRSATLAGLSDRELQVLRLIGMGHATASIAQSLQISVKTVGTHRENLKNKLNCDNSAKLVQKAIQMVESSSL